MPGSSSPFWGSRIVTDIPLEALLPHLDRKSLFTLGWGLTGPDARKLASDVGEPRLQHWLGQLDATPIIQPKVVYGYFPAESSGESVIVTSPEAGADPVTFTFPRQQRDPNRCLADWMTGFLPLQLVTVGESAADYARRLNAADRYRDYFEFNALAAALTEALADYWHSRIRAELGIPADQGERFSIGYPACPNLADRKKVVELLRPERIGVHLTEGYQLEPEYSTEALIITDPKARYFRP